MLFNFTPTKLHKSHQKAKQREIFRTSKISKTRRKNKKKIVIPDLVMILRSFGLIGLKDYLTTKNSNN